MKELLRKLLGIKYEPLNTIYISKKNLLSNHRYLKKKNRKIKIAPVVKSNAYGHGIVLVAKALDNFHPPFFCVDSIFEAYQLLNAKIKTPILIMGYVAPENLKNKKLPFSYAVYNREQIYLLNKYQKGAKIHLKLDTGMHRLGITHEELPEIVQIIKKSTNLALEGVMSHLAFPTRNELTRKQIKNFKKAVEYIEKEGFDIKWKHLGASGGTLNMDLSQVSNLARVGHALYGFNPGKPFDKNLKPVLSLHTKIASLKKIRKGEFVGYGGAFRAKKDIILALLPAGYNDGVDRRLSNKGVVLVGKTYCPIVGRISMNITSIDVSGVKTPKIGQDVTIYSDNKIDKNSLESTAAACKTIAGELLVHLTSSTRRVVI